MIDCVKEQLEYISLLNQLIKHCNNTALVAQDYQKWEDRVQIFTDYKVSAVNQLKNQLEPLFNE